jgi:hypothetical protein
MVRSGQKGGVSRLATLSPGRVFPRGSGMFLASQSQLLLFLTSDVHPTVQWYLQVVGPYELSQYRTLYIRFHPAWLHVSMFEI